MKQPLIGKFVTQYWQDPEVSVHSRTTSLDNGRTFRIQPCQQIQALESKCSSLTQRPTDHKRYTNKQTNCPAGSVLKTRRQCRTCSVAILTAHSLYKARHDRMLRPVYHVLLEGYGFEESKHSTPQYKQSHPQPSQENNKAKFLWDIPENWKNVQ